MLFTLIILVLSANHARAESCINVTAIKNFDAVQYEGTWYEYSRSEGSALEEGTKCNYETYTLLSNGSYDVENQGINEITGEVQPIPSIMILTGDGSGESNSYLWNLDAWVACYFLDTDYENWGIPYCCYNNEALYWVMTRTRQPLEEHVASAKAAFQEAANIDASNLPLVDQSNCD